MTTEIKTPPMASNDTAPDLQPATERVMVPESHVLAAATAQSLAPHLEATRRKKTWGERLFDLTTYGGFALVGNEVTATHILKQADKPNLLGRAYQVCDKFFQNIGTPGKLPYLQKRINFINFAIIGGFTMVPIIKLLEDNKGRCVRFADQIFYGDAAKEPAISNKHDEMDNAPKQTWGSLGKGRLLTVASAYTVDSTINWKDGLLARSLKGTRHENHASLEHLSDHAANWLNEKISAVRKLSPEKMAGQKKFLGTLVGLTTLSATLTLIFYASSKLFARKQEEKVERREYVREHPEARRDELDGTALPTTQLDTAEAAKLPEQPVPQVNSVAHQQTVGTDPSLAPAV